jgi:hypothetical protein
MSLLYGPRTFTAIYVRDTPLGVILIQMHPFHIFIYHVFTIHFNIISSYGHRILFENFTLVSLKITPLVSVTLHSTRNNNVKCKTSFMKIYIFIYIFCNLRISLDVTVPNASDCFYIGSVFNMCLLK